ncbi:MAG: nucleoside 2-deoxyribosyltransferase domain-containing protein [Bacillota bacterium]
MKVFLGGTCNNSDWREKLISMLDCDYFNPVVDDWDEEARKREEKEKENADFRLYVITSEMKGVYSIAEVVDDSNKHPYKTIFCVLENGFDEGELRSLNAVKEIVKNNVKNKVSYPRVYDNLESVAALLNEINKYHDLEL